MRSRATKPEMVGKCRVISSSGGGGAPMPAKVLALGRMKAGEMNQTEAAYGAVLEQRRQAGEVVWYRFEGINLRLADNTHYRPDFAVQLASGVIEIHEVKGHWADDARVKIKVAADQYPFRFVAVTKKKGGGWSLEEFS